VLGTPVTTYKDIVSLKLSSMPASALPKNALGVRADPKGQVSLTPHTPEPHQNLTHVQSYPPPPPQTPQSQSKIAPPGIVGKGAEKLISAEDAAQVAEAVGRKRTSAC